MRGIVRGRNTADAVLIIAARPTLLHSTGCRADRAAVHDEKRRSVTNGLLFIKQAIEEEQHHGVFFNTVIWNGSDEGLRSSLRWVTALTKQRLILTIQTALGPKRRKETPCLDHLFHAGGEERVVSGTVTHLIDDRAMIG